jgi:ABC-2 type transport system ATP-binding protein
MAAVEELCDTLTVVNQDRVIFAGTVDELRRSAAPPMHSLHTSDNRAAPALASARHGVRAVESADDGLDVAANVSVLDAYVIALGHAGVAVRRLAPRARSLESSFLQLTNRKEVQQDSASPSEAFDQAHDERAAAS